jgi:PIN domain nuclease of toxin-antitoxin system
LRAWFEELAGQARTAALTPAIADTASSLPPAFPKDPADRIIYATAIERGWRLVTKDAAMREYKHTRRITIW